MKQNDKYITKWLEMFKEKHDNKYTYFPETIGRAKDSMKINCPIHGIFYQRPDNHKLRGCDQCAREESGKIRTKDSNYWIPIFKNKYHNKYDYSKASFTGSKNKIEIICPIHCSFWQYPLNHAQDRECAKCFKQDKLYSEPSIKGRKSTLYILHCYNNEESFYKIGLTSSTLKQRFTGPCRMPYEFSFLLGYQTYTSLIRELETNILRKHAPYKYIPLNRFQGDTECRSQLDFTWIKNFIESRVLKDNEAILLSYKLDISNLGKWVFNF